MKNPKEITINYLLNIRKDKQNTLDTRDLRGIESVKLGLCLDMQTIDRVISIVKGSEGTK